MTARGRANDERHGPPDYVPSHWTDGKTNRWVAAKPSRVLAILFQALKYGPRARRRG